MVVVMSQCFPSTLLKFASIPTAGGRESSWSEPDESPGGENWGQHAQSGALPCPSHLQSPMDI